MTKDVLETFWREVIKAWDSDMAENEGLMVTIGRPVIEAARSAAEPCANCARLMHDIEVGTQEIAKLQGMLVFAHEAQRTAEAETGKAMAAHALEVASLRDALGYAACDPGVPARVRAVAQGAIGGVHEPTPPRQRASDECTKCGALLSPFWSFGQCEKCLRSAISQSSEPPVRLLTERVCELGMQERHIADPAHPPGSEYRYSVEGWEHWQQVNRT